MLHRLYNWLFIHWLYNRFFIDSTIDSSSTLQLILHSSTLQSILHWTYNWFFIDTTINLSSNLPWFPSIPLDSSVNTSFILHWLFINSSSTIHWFFCVDAPSISLSNFHQLFFHFLINSPRILWISSIPSISYTSTILLRLLGDLRFIDSTFFSSIDSLHSNRFYLH